MATHSSSFNNNTLKCLNTKSVFIICSNPGCYKLTQETYCTNCTSKSSDKESNSELEQEYLHRPNYIHDNHFKFDFSYTESNDELEQEYQEYLYRQHQLSNGYRECDCCAVEYRMPEKGYWNFFDYLKDKDVKMSKNYCYRCSEERFSHGDFTDEE